MFYRIVFTAMIVTAAAPLASLYASNWSDAPTGAAATGPAKPADAASRAQVSAEALQDEFLKLKFGMFLHFNLATYKGVELVEGYQNPADFNPGVKMIDTDAWADAAKAAGMKYGVLTAKHGSGFCL
jgi:alpha-L-fucosidase